MGLFGLAALLPIIALYFLKLRREERVVPSTLLWKKVIEDLHVNAPFQRLRYSLLLLLQLLVAALLGFALARPFLSMPGTQGKRIVMLIDTSASMGTRDAGPNGKMTRLEHAVMDAKAKIDDLGRGGEVRIVTFDEEVRQLSRFTSDRYFLKDKLNSLEPRHLRTEAQEAFETTLALAEERANTEVLVLSDGSFDRLSLMRLLGGHQDVEETNLEELSLARLSKFRYVAYGKDESNNIGITNISARTRNVEALDSDGEKVDALETQIFVMVENFSSEDKDVILSLATPTRNFPPKVIKLKARPRGEVTLSDDPEQGHTLEASRSQEVFRLPLDTTGVVTATITSPADSFVLDNQANVVVGHAEDTNILFVTKGNYFMEKAFKTMRGAKVSKMVPEEFNKDWTARGTAAVEEYDAVVFEQCVPPRWDDGGALFIGEVPPLPGFKLNEEEKERKFPLVIDWDNVHPVMRYVNFGNIQVAKAPNWVVPKTAKILVEAAGGPLITAYESDRVHAVGVAFSLLDSDWPYRPSLPLFVRNAVAWASEVSPRRRAPMLRTGNPLVVPPIGTAPSATLVAPDGSKVEVSLSAENKTFVKDINQVGMYRLTGLPGSVEDEMLFAVNLADPHESDNPARKKVAIGQTEDSALEASAAAITAKREFWRTLVLIAIGFLLLEWWVYHRRMGL